MDMNRLAQRLKALSPQQRERLQKQLKKEGIDISRHMQEVFLLQNIEKKEYYPSSFAQKRLYILHRLETESLPYNVPEALDLKIRINKDRLEKIVRKLIERHESLRTSFDIVNEDIVQKIHDRVDIKIEYYTAGKSVEKKAAALEIEKVKNNFIRPFDLSKAPLLRVGAIEAGEQRHILLLDLHHIITDASSQAVLVNDLKLLFEEEDLPPLRFDYKCFSEWERRKLSHKTRISEAKAFFETQILRDYEPLNLPYNYFRSNVKTRSSSLYHFVIPEALTAKLRKVAVENGANLFVVMLSVFSLIIAEISNRDDVIIGIPGAARFHEELKNVVGMFINTLILRARINRERPYAEHLKRIKDTAIKTLEYRDFPLELIYDKQAAKYPDIQVFFNMLNARGAAKEGFGNFSQGHIAESHISIWDMVFYIEEYTGAIGITCNYLNELFKSETIEKIVKLYNATLEKVVKGHNEKVGDFFRTEKRKRLQRNRV
jgi:hypothetical protein